MGNAVGAANEEQIDLRVRQVSAGVFWIGLLGTVFLAKLLLAWRFPGFLTGDDLEVLQTAAKYAWGLDYQPWGLRCLFHPLTFVRPFLELAYDLGTRDPAVLSWLGTVPAAAASTAGAWLLHAFARERGLPESGSRAAAFLYAFHWLPLGYGATHYPRPISAALLLAAFVLVSRTPPRPASDAVAGALAAAAFATRWSEGVVLVVLLAWTWYIRRDLRALARILAGFAAGAALLIGVFDALTWGEPFASLREYFGLIQVGAPPSSPSTDQPFFWYFTTPLRWAGPLLLLLAALGWKDRRGREALAILAGVLLLLSFFPYKAWRYLQSAIPFLALAAAVGWLRVRDLRRGGRFLATAALVLAVPIGLERTWTLLRDKSQSAVAAARYIAALRPPPRVVALEQAWAFGERIYLGNGPRIRDIPVSRPLSPEAVRREASGADVVAIYSKDTSPEVLAVLAGLDFGETARFKRDTSREVVVYLPLRASR